MNKISNKFLTLVLILGVTGCGYVDNYDRREKYLEAQSIKAVVIPEGLDQPPFEDALVIPDVIDSRGIAGKKVVVDLPPTLSTTFGVDAIVLKTLGDTRWIFLDSSPALVWPKIRRFWEENNLEIQQADPRTGIIESTWITSIDGEREEMYESLTSGTAWADSDASIQSKLRLTIEPGIRNGSSEVYIEQKQVPLNSPVRPDSADWDGTSDNEQLEAEILKRLANYLGENIDERIISYGAIGLRLQKAELIPDSTKPVLNYKLSFDRAWSTVESALQNARIKVEDIDRTSGLYYIYYDESISREPGFFSSLFSRGREEELGQMNRYVVHLETVEDVVAVTVLKEVGAPADADIAERLLKIIKESST